MKPVKIAAEDKITLSGRLFQHSNAVGMTVFHGATGVPFGYYAAFAAWYSERKRHHVLIYAYRDTENIIGKALRKSRTTMGDWGVKDQAAALDYMIATFPDLPVHTMGHSLGGFCIPFHENADRIVQHTAVNSGPAYILSHPLSFIWKAFALWYVIGPVSAFFFGYLPGKRIGLNADIPSSVYWQWSRWCTNEAFHKIDWGTKLPQPDLERFTGKLKLVGTIDDYTIPPARVRELKRFFPCAESEFSEIDPACYGGNPIGHIALFSKRNSAAWEALL